MLVTVRSEISRTSTSGPTTPRARPVLWLCRF